MKTMIKINQLWEELANDKSHTYGLLLRRYSSTILPDIHAAYQNPEKYLCLCISINSNTEVNISNFSNLEEIQVDIVASISDNNKKLVVFKLLNLTHKDIFAVLCEDLIASIANEENERVLVKEILNRFEKWKSLFKKLNSNGLSAEKQRGLYGELFFLRKFLLVNEDYLTVLDTWVGPENQVRDFQFNSWAVEVKTTIGNNHQKVRISSERQLDSSNLENLILYHISLEQLQNSGESLNDIILSISNILQFDSILLMRFRSKIYEVGYFELDRNLYDFIGYSIRNDKYYFIENEFPRIEENDIRQGIGDVKYSIILSQCLQYIIEEKNVFEKIKI